VPGRGSSHHPPRRPTAHMDGTRRAAVAHAHRQARKAAAVAAACRCAGNGGVSPVPVLDAEAAAGVGPLDVVELVADDPAGAALDAALVGEENPPVRLRGVARRRATVDALLALALKADVGVDDADVSAGRVDVVGVDGELALKPRSILDPVTNYDCHTRVSRHPRATRPAAPRRYPKVSGNCTPLRIPRQRAETRSGTGVPGPMGMTSHRTT